MGTMRSAGLVSLILVLLPLLLAGSAGAHAILQSAQPQPNGRVPEGLDLLVLTFTEPVEHEFTGADVIDSSGESWAAGPVEFDDAQRNVIRLPLKALPSGVYSASWKALSADTHTTRGAYVFAVGNATLRTTYEPLVDAPEPGSVLRDGFARFTFFAGLFLALGMPLFALAVLREAPPRALFLTAALFGALGALGALVGLFLLGERTALGWGAIATGPGRSFALRGALLALAAAASVLGAMRPARWRGASVAAIGLGAAAILATSLGSHAASSPDDTALLVAADAVHLAMGSVWVGGVVAFLLVALARDAPSLARLVFRFSPLAVASVVLLLATGTLASAAHIPCLTSGDLASCAREATTEPYTRLVLLKLALMVPLIALGAYNQQRVAPRLARGEYAPSAFRRALAAEAIVMTVVVVAAGVLAASPPPADETQGAALPASLYFEQENVTAKSHVILQITPNPVTVGVQTVTVAVHPLGGRLPNGTLVALKVWAAGEAEPEDTINLEKVSPSEWEITDGVFTTPGDWNVLVILQRPDEYAKIPFNVPVSGAGS